MKDLLPSLHRLRTAWPILLAIPVLSGCVTAPKGEYRSGLYLHEAPRYSFRVPEGWRPATPEDGPSFAHMAANLRFLDDEGKRAALEAQRKSLSQQDAILISERGAAIAVRSERSKFTGLSIPRGTLPEGQRKEFVDALVARHPSASVESMELLAQSATPGLLTRLRTRGVLATVAVFVNAGDGVLLMHVGTPDDPAEGFIGFERLIQAFRFDTSSARPASTPSVRAPSGRIRLPADARVSVPGPTVSRGLAAYSGRWAGWWNDQIEHVLLVEEITQTTAVLVYAVVGRTGPTWTRYRASVVDGSLQVKTRDHVVTYTLDADDTLLATQESAAVILRARLRREP